MEYQSYFDIPVVTQERKVPTDDLNYDKPSRQSNPKRVKMVRRFSLESMTAIEEDEDTLAGRRHCQQKHDDDEWIPEADPYEWLPDLDDDTDGDEKVIESIEGCFSVGDSSDSDTEDGGARLDIPFETPTEVHLEDSSSEDPAIDSPWDVIDNPLTDPFVEPCTETHHKVEVESEDAVDMSGNNSNPTSTDQPPYPEQSVYIDGRGTAPAVRIGTVGRSRILGNTIAYRRAMRAYGIQTSYGKALDMSRITGWRQENEAMKSRQPHLFCIQQEKLERFVEMVKFAGYPYQIHGLPNQHGFLDVVVGLPRV
ncbi:hypothetical protein DL546_000950 [Coniochaeta pulveracea]|uniref:Uncharacterized protein n=1 Tax=Coniochaeta pulveracea TaxID=177199 RepID=A0A420YKR0_9PEZI|nr:hypothetical protein DL546_000950 [Coniochaeta pulveracea]